MKFAVLFILLAGFAHARPEIVTAPVDHLYIPEGFDNNDSVEIVVTGTFPNPCFARNTVQVNINDSMIDIHISAILPKASINCIDMAVPFQEVISLGTLQGGEYGVRVNHRSPFELTESLQIKEATSHSVDENIYAAIDRIENVSENNYIFHGWKYSHCIEFSKVEILSNKRDTLSVLPMMKQVSDFCPMKMTAVSFPVKLDLSEMETKQPLIHVRTMDGKSFNKVLNLAERR